MCVETAKAVRAELKSAGYNARLVSVRNQSYSTDSSVSVTIRSATVPLGEIKSLAERFQRVDRDHTGEILAGGNTYLHVEYGRGVLDEHAKRVADQLQAGRYVFGSFRVGQDSRDPDALHVWTADRHVTRLSLSHGAPVRLTRVLAEAGELACLDEPAQTERVTPANDTAA